MQEWEKNCAARDQLVRKGEVSHEEAKEISREELKKVFKEYCTTWEVPARASGGSIFYDRPPSYDPKTEEFLKIDIGKKTAKVLTQQKTGLQTKCVYRLRLCEDGWRIQDNRKCIDMHGNETPWDL
jgi:hypothetical protein